MDGMAGKLLTAVQALEFNEKIQPDDLASQLSDERYRGSGRASGGQKVIDDQHPFAHVDRIAMDGKRVRPIFETVFHFKTVGRQLAGLSDRNEPGIQALGQDPAKNKASRLDADHFC